MGSNPLVGTFPTLFLFLGKKWEMCPPKDSNPQPHTCEATVLSLVAITSSPCCVKLSRNYAQEKTLHRLDWCTTLGPGTTFYVNCAVIYKHFYRGYAAKIRSYEHLPQQRSQGHSRITGEGVGGWIVSSRLVALGSLVPNFAILPVSLHLYSVTLLCLCTCAYR